MAHETTVGELLLRGQRPSLRVSKVAALLEVDISTVYRLVRNGSLEAHRIGRRGVRIFADSVRCYQENQTIGTMHAVSREITGKVFRGHSPAYQEALDFLKETGIL